ncbi:MAG: oxidoreductase [Planctomycetota bacterium]|nr:MAG: oxidoreductase [Planctomycetota bacterium]
MDLGLSDKVVLITGASGGIGRALAQVFGAEGSSLVLGGHRNLQPLAEWVAQQPFAERALVLPFDVTDETATTAAYAQAVERFGRVDVAIANAGVWPIPDEALAQMSVERLSSTLQINLLGAALTARGFLASLARTGPRDDGHGAALLFTGSTAARFGERGHSDYALAKAGLTGLVQSLKHEIVDLDRWGRVNLVQPGWTVTHMARPALRVPGVISRVVSTMPLRQLARARDIATCMASLASPVLSRHVTGEVLTVAGGMEGRLRWSPDELDEDAVRARLEQE